MIKKIKYLTLLLFGLFSFLFISNMCVKASTLEMDLEDNIWVFRKGGGLPAHSTKFANYYMDGKVSYCIESGVKITTYDYIGKEGWINSPYSMELNNKLQLIGYYGYDYPGHNTLRYKMAAQSLIWETIGDYTGHEGLVVEFWTKASGAGDIIRVTQEKNEIMALVNAHTNKPVFDVTIKETTIGNEIYFTDTTDFLSQYEVESANGATTRIDGNKLYVTPTKVGDITILLNRKSYTTNKTIIFVGIDEESQKIGYFGLNDPQHVALKLKSIGGKIKLTKVDNETNTIVAQGQATLVGAIYDVYDSNNKVVSSITIGSDMTGTSGNLGLGTFTIKERTPSKGYQLDTNTYKVTIDSSDTVNLTVKENVIKAPIKITKLDKDNNACKASGEGSLVGATYEIYDWNNNKVDTVTIGNDCTATSKSLVYGKYTVKETKASNGYLIDNTSYTANVLTHNVSVNVTSKEQIIKAPIKITKFDSKTNKCEARGDGELKGAIYEIFNNKKELVDTITIKEDCTGTSKALPYGTYIIKEKSASKGYLIDNNSYSVTVLNNNELLNVTSKEDIIEIDFELYKVEADSKTGIMTAEPNVTFEFYLKSENTLQTSGTTDKNGHLIVKLPYGTYIVKQVNATENFEKKEDFEIVVDENTDSKVTKVISNAPITAKIRVVKIDADTKEVINRSNIKFKIYDVKNERYVCQTITYPTKETICEFKTDDKGEFTTPYPLIIGTYRLEEVDQKVDGYLWNNVSHEFTIDENSELVTDSEYGVIFDTKFENKRVIGKIKLEKSVEIANITNNGYEYKQGKLKGIKFGLYALEDIISNGKIVINKNELVKEGVTNDNGEIIFDDLYLGKYYLQEIETLSNYVLDTNKYEVELKYKDQYTPTIVYSKTLINKLKKGKLEFTKTDISESKPLPNTLVEIYTNKDELIFSGRTDKNGKIIISELPIGKYYILEKEAPEGYKLNIEKMYFEIKENSEVVKAIMKDEDITGKLEFTKLDFSEDLPLPNTLIEIYNEKDELVFSGRTDEFGKIVIEKLKYGKYYILEKEAPEGYQLNPDKMHFEIKEDGVVVKAVMKDYKIIKVPKTDKNDYRELIISGVTLLVTGTILVIYGKKKKDQ